MTTEEFYALWGDDELRQYIVDTAKGRSKRKEIQEEFVQEAWLCISCAPAGYSLECYCELADKAIYSSYWQTRKEYILMQAMNSHVEASRHKTPEELTDNDKRFMQEVKEKDWRN